ncbi:hypothetical protein [Lacimicrobium alkaliphilum]|uniref:Flagellin N-terminal domain-containing protein n=1 Tax=Lacimicrobium alkaliphilum TaxID=1526571 RepID=A0ABQ1RIX7_9ALTE|nr:hypothetical protein [Lacimicrobium alkaliphilum]GGD69799.1 hypothetical protein GCM10011357_26040 [Lacimicrobium alkaliphilum]
MSLLQSITSSNMDRLSRIEVATNQVNSGMLTLRRNEKDFLLRGDISYQDKFNTNYNTLQATTSLLRSELAAAGLPEQKAQRLIEILREYKDKFDALIQQSVEVGLTPESGYYGALRSAVHNVEEQVDTAENDALKADMLMSSIQSPPVPETGLTGSNMKPSLWRQR